MSGMFPQLTEFTNLLGNVVGRSCTAEQLEWCQRSGKSTVTVFVSLRPRVSYT